MKKTLSKPLKEIAPHYEIIVIGSGYGGGVSASRLARAGREVCVIERGREIRPGNYPKTMQEAVPETQINTSQGHYGSRTALFDVRANPDMNVLIGCGLGGTSLINSNVSLEVKKDLFSRDCWPKEFRENENILDEYYERARKMLGANPYPDDFPELAKNKSLEHSANQMGLKENFTKPPLNVTFKDGTNYAGVKQKACNMCGDCMSGCNVGAKNTTLMNYLPDAVNHGAHIFCEAEAHLIRKIGDKWSIIIQSRHADNDFKKEVSADIVIIAAGTLGTSELLLRSKKEGLSLSSKLGERFSGNGDIFAYGYDGYDYDGSQKISNSKNTIQENIQSLVKKFKPEEKKPKLAPVYSNGVSGLSKSMAKRPGPCITSMIDLRDESRPMHERILVQDGVLTRVLAEGLEPALFFRNVLENDFFKYGPSELAYRLEDAEKFSNKLLKNDHTNLPYSDVMNRTQYYVAMGHDNSSGKMELDSHDRVRIKWPNSGLDPAIVYENEIVKEACEAVHSQFLTNPIWNKPSDWGLMTVHPVGGCKLADDATEGVVNHACQVFSQNKGTAVHEGLYICDGSVLPESIGVNPLLTISAITERACELLCKSKGWTYEIGAASLKKELSFLHAKPENSMTPVIEKVKRSYQESVQYLGTKILQKLIQKYPHQLSPILEFSETMRGHAEIKNNSNLNKKSLFSNEFQIAEYRGKENGQPIIGEFTVRILNIEHMIANPDHEAELSGKIYFKSLQPEAMILSDAKFNLFQVNQDNVASWLMRYRGWLEVENKKRYFFDGFKKLEHSSEGHWITDTTTLNVKIYEGVHPIAVGIMRIEIDELFNQISSLKIEPGQSWWLNKLKKYSSDIYNGISAVSAGNFVGFFGQTVIDSYGGLLSNLGNFSEIKNNVAVKNRRPLKAPQARFFYSDLAKKGKFKLTRYQGGNRGPIVLAPGFSVRASSFATTTVDQNLVEFLVDQHYDVWLFDYRASPSSGFSTETFTIDDIALEDWFGAVEIVKKVSGQESIQVIAHCVGAMTLMMAQCAGLKGVRHAIVSQLSLHPVTNWLNYLKTDIDTGEILQSQGMKTLNINTTDEKEDKMLDTMLWNVPVPEGEECNNPTCRRIFATFGASYTHAQLNEETHNALSEMFGEINTSPSDQLSKIIKTGHAVDASGKNRYLPHVDRLAYSIDFIAGGKNQIFHPETSERTLEWLNQHNDSSLYSRKIFHDYAHMDFFIGKNANKDVFPYLLERLEKNNN